MCGRYRLCLWPIWSSVWPISLWPIWFVADIDVILSGLTVIFTGQRVNQRTLLHMALSPDHTQLICASYQFQSPSMLYKQETHRPKCISSRDGVHGTEQRQKISLAWIIPVFARIILRESSDKPARIIHCAHHLATFALGSRLDRQ